MTLAEATGLIADWLWTAGFFLVSILIIVFVHEFGHYIVGRLSGIRAEVFSLGFGRVLWSRHDRHGTRWQLAAIPLGGFVKFLGDANAASANPDLDALARLSAAERRHTLHGAPLWARAATVLAGPLFNVALTVAVFALMVAVWGVVRLEDRPVVSQPRALPGDAQTLVAGDVILAVDGAATPDVASLYAAAGQISTAPATSYRVLRGEEELTLTGPYLLSAVVGSVLPQSAANDAGIAPGDVVLSVDGRAVSAFAEIPPLIEAAQGAPVTLAVWRAGTSFDLTLTPRRRDLPGADGGFETRWLIGFTSSMPFDLSAQRPGPAETLGLAWAATVRVAESSIDGLVAIIRGQISSCNISGAITMAQVMGDAAASGLESFLAMLAVLSLGIGLMNLLPVPVLDGGHLMFHAYEAIAGRPPSARVLERLTLIGLALVLGVMAYALRNDLVCV